MSTFLRVWLAPFVAVAALLLLLRTLDTDGPLLVLEGAASTFGTLLLAIVVQAVPFLVLGVVVSGAIAAWMPKDVLSRVTPRSPMLAVPTAGVAGMVLPGCECASVPVSQSLMRRGLPQAAALAFLLAAPAVNPIVLVATAVAFQGNQTMVWARFVASLLAVVVIGWAWGILGREEGMKSQGGHEPDDVPRSEVFRETAVHDLLQAGGFLVVGAAAAAFLKAFVPTSVLTTLGDHPWLAVLAMAGLAVALSLCSEADAFVVSSLTSVSPTAQLAFLVVGPMVDIKLFAMQSGAFGTKFATRFMPLTLVVCIGASVLVGRLIFGTF